MSQGLLGKKIGMTHVFDESGKFIPITVISLEDGNKVVQIKTKQNDGYNAIKVAFGNKKPPRATRVTKAMQGIFAKAGVTASYKIREFRIEDVSQFTLGQSLLAEQVFSVGQFVDVSCEHSKGKGFAGVIKRHNFSSNRASHGNSRSHNTPGSTGQRQDPGRVFPGKKMAGHLGDVRKTVQNLSIVKIDVERGLIMVKGAVPGAQGAYLEVTPAVKMMGVK
jgi:large subunit ribosomal protein L3